jgi:hypothetical protein
MYYLKTHNKGGNCYLLDVSADTWELITNGTEHNSIFPKDFGSIFLNPNTLISKVLVSFKVYHKADSTWYDLSKSLKDVFDINYKVTDGCGRFNFKIMIEGNYMFLNQDNKIHDILFPNDIIEIKIDDTTLLVGTIESSLPVAADNDWVHQQTIEISGRDYGADLLNREVAKTGNWGYSYQSATSIISDMLASAGSDITVSASGIIPFK